MQEIVDILVSTSGKYNYHTVFQDWVAAMAISIQNSCCIFHDKEWEERECLYKNIINKYSSHEIQNFCKMFAILTEEFEKGNIRDILGEIYMSQQSGNSRLGQFFTPFHLSDLCARLSLKQNKQLFEDNGIVEINEPSTGGGGMMIATVRVLKEMGINYQKKIHIVAQDLDWNGVYMTYTQLSLLGVKAIVVQGDTLKEPYKKGYDKSRVLRTPAEMGALL